MSKGDILDITISITTDKGEKYVGTAKLTKAKKGKKNYVKKLKREQHPTPTSALRNLYEGGFFKTKINFATIISQLSSIGMNFTEKQVATAIIRANYLKRDGKRRKYTYIQKFPPT